ncbi:hypothetical protein PBY51_009184 [Eleginops maclovinus]|uniref:Uncharacterized protein n=1 Tax=Eleginops maclovinus TaxID=56733 RepID=A0AAN7XWY2_ELEMC|nr:hypothetical protein PBY51_009184 [Eleginops maclovinus]
MADYNMSHRGAQTTGPESIRQQRGLHLSSTTTPPPPRMWILDTFRAYIRGWRPDWPVSHESLQVQC